ncbi:MAG: hypothetical protein KAI47_09185 [Deltaproteobacteria bacterium]|nr:hypothetical protein [Deltaproteobacteria bacterium]
MNLFSANMVSLRQLAIVSLFVLPLSLSACGDDAPPSMQTCSAATCALGCCDSAGKCTTPASSKACGIFGAQCTAWVDCAADESCDGVGRTCVKDTAVCGPATCIDGCCDGNTCVKNVDARKCGARGAACMACKPLESCIAGSCGKDCGPATCVDGCCQKNVCFAGDNVGICGKGGAACKACGNGEACVDKACVVQACNATTCPLGCCDAKGSCVQGDTEAACGKGGAACKLCVTGEFCDKDRACTKPTVNCDATTCADGCCDAHGKCVKIASQDGTSCGKGGGACDTCAATQACESGSCVCTATSCKSGCCDGASCRSGSSNTACGAAGAKCDICTGSESCQGGICKSTYDCAKQCAGCCAGNTCILNGATNDPQCGKGGAACVNCTTAAKTCKNGICLGSGICAACGVGTCCTTTGCANGDQDKTCGDNGDACDDCTAELLPMVCDKTDRKCTIDPNSTWKVTVISVVLKTSYNFEGSQGASKPWNAPDPFVELAVNGTSTSGTTKTVDNDYSVTFDEVVLAKVKAALLLPDATGTSKFTIKVYDDDTWPNPNDEIAFCEGFKLTAGDFGGATVKISDCRGSASPPSYWNAYMIDSLTIRIEKD